MKALSIQRFSRKRKNLRMENNFLSPECPWTSFEFGKVISCEERLCGWVRQPMNTYSSIVFFLAAFALLWNYRKERKLSDFVFGLGLIWMGVASTLNHASQIKVLVSLDFLAIYMLAVALLVTSLLQTKKIPSVRWGVVLYVFLVSLAIFAQYFHVRYSIPLTGGVVAAVLAVEALTSRLNRANHFRYLFSGLATLVLGAFCYYLDTSGEHCVPANHWFQWHAVWHVLSVSALCFFALHYRQYYRRQPT